ncbi:hypothetical protein [Burkholderia lata]|uniref:hypothetical protein n=1 Tax=Burkholderia lata (strain ATCC 17760 / DSM 23089 / LMG 22485 / NCIMB 9086 / R18194 / 383) TaxID=482957 RepID=UPI0014536949|nr:hypothetical protein [Burkholderia lata]VWB64661.1 hypothetical protein BLA15816_03051 [Burkholderia lata]
MSIDWEFWLALQTIEEWQACALSVNLDPDKLRLDQYANAYAKAGSMPVYDPLCFLTAEQEDKFKKRLRLLASVLSTDQPHFRRPLGIPQRHGHRQIYLADFSVWAMSIATRDELPLPLTDFAKSVERVPPLANRIASAHDEAESSCTKRERQIRAIESMADELGFPRSEIPSDGKQTLKQKCKERWPQLFGAGDDPFLDSWKEGLKGERFRTVDHEKFSRR